MEKTIAFSNSGNVWVSRYSYTSSCFGWVKDQMISSPKSTTSTRVLWLHDKNSVSNNSFYGSQSVSSGISFAFNNNPSANKIYKAFSIETPDILAIQGVNTFIVNNGTGNSIKKNARVNQLKSKGGILYGGVEGVVELGVANVRALGIVESITRTRGSFYIKISGPTSQHSGGRAVIVKTEDLQAAKENPNAGWASVFSDGYFDGGYFVSTSGRIEVGDEVVILYLDINFDQPKGQFADVSVTFGVEDFEVHSLNVDFEATPLDHNS